MKPELWQNDPGASRSRRSAAAAHAYARLLVSDIRLYHEEDVIVGRLEKDLAARLGDAIAVARKRYLERHADPAIFETELVRILAGGDPGSLS